MKNKRIFIKCIEPAICKHQMSDIIEYHDGNYDIDVWCGLSKERIKCKQSTCKKKEYSGIPYDTAIEKMARAICSCFGVSSCKSCMWKGTVNCSACVLAHKTEAEAALKALLEE